jgi:ABC-type multidrug transport system fused ATPase/permease subunit
MSAISQPVAGTTHQQEKQKKPSGWDQLRHLIPYLTRYKGMAALGLLALTLMGLVGALPQLIIGSIVDLLKGSPQPLSTLGGASRAVLHPLFSFYAPLNRHALGLYCLILLGVMLLKGFLSFWSRWILIGISREIEYDLRNDLLARLVKLEPEFYVRNRTGDLMSRVTNDLNAVRMVLGPGIMYSATTFATMVLAIFFMAKLSSALTLSGALRGDLRALLRADHSPALGADPGVARSAFHTRAGKPYRHSRDTGLRAGKTADNGVRRGEPGLRESEHQADRLLESVLPRAFLHDRDHGGDSAFGGR